MSIKEKVKLALNSIRYILFPTGRHKKASKYGGIGYTLVGDRFQSSLPYYSAPAEDRKEIISSCRMLMQRNPYARMIKSMWHSYILGPDGISFVAQTEDDQLAEKVNSFLSSWMDAVDWRSFEKSVLERYLKDGEIFVVIYNESEGRPLEFIEPSFIAPEFVSSPLTSYNLNSSQTGKVIEGFQYSGRRFVGVWVDREGDYEFIDIDKLNVMQAISLDDSPRALPALRPVMFYLYWLEKTIDNIRMTVDAQSQFAATIEYPEGVTIDKITSQAEDDADFIDTDPETGEAVRVELLSSGGQIVHAINGTKLQFPSNHIDPSKPIQLVREMLLAVCAGANLNIDMFNPSATNYASADIGYAFIVDAFRAIQNEFKLYYKKFFEQAIAHAVKMKLLPSESLSINLKAILTEHDTVRMTDKVDAITKLVDRRIISLKTAREQLGFDAEREASQIEQELLEEIGQ